MKTNKENQSLNKQVIERDTSNSISKTPRLTAHDGVELENATWISTCHFSRIMRMTSFVDYGRLDRGFIEKSILIREFTEEINCPPTSGSLSSQ